MCISRTGSPESQPLGSSITELDEMDQLIVQSVFVFHAHPETKNVNAVTGDSQPPKTEMITEFWTLLNKSLNLFFIIIRMFLSFTVIPFYHY